MYFDYFMLFLKREHILNIVILMLVNLKQSQHTMVLPYIKFDLV